MVPSARNERIQSCSEKDCSFTFTITDWFRANLEADHGISHVVTFENVNSRDGMTTSPKTSINQLSKFVPTPCPFGELIAPIRERKAVRPHCRTFQIVGEFRQCQDDCRGLPRVLGSCQRRFVKQIGVNKKYATLMRRLLCLGPSSGRVLFRLGTSGVAAKIKLPIVFSVFILWVCPLLLSFQIF
ncbi:hypothetical protein CDAR_76451 [Caerostris darwini]|uniref:Uncharacterized protein n=1 Tax=Caerostris darwini TaxID=1538125 RepID=A0AAV4QBX8_9ARAC|nr:hypothetical protein CDAR_76451 [Caerostris darwini]